MTVEEYRAAVHEDITAGVKTGDTDPKEEFLIYATGILIKGEVFDDYIDCPFEGTTGSTDGMRIDGYSRDEMDGSCSIIISDYHGPGQDDYAGVEEVEDAYKKARRFVEEASKRDLSHELHGNSQAAELARDLFFDSEDITKYRFFYLTDAFFQRTAKTAKDDTLYGKSVELEIWDIDRFFSLVSSAAQRESVEIFLPDFGLPGIACVKAVDYVDVTADIDVIPKMEGEPSDTGEKPANIVTYSSYLAVVPGRLLNELYLEYGSKLLEGNVRSFLSTKGKVNKSIQNTIKLYPEMFFAYNNGIAAVATELDTEMTPEGLVITRIKDLQIVNGGQTTASIANTLLKAKKNESIDISHLFVPMKISVLERSMAERIIPKISEYSNSQNKVDASDFFSTHPFHERMEKYSRNTPIPNTPEIQVPQYWFYERTRGQYNQGKMKFAARSKELKEYGLKYPEKNVITMLDLARYMEIYECAPDVVSKGKQRTLQVFSEHVKKEWEKSNDQFNPYYYRRAVAIAILYRKTDEIIREATWYKEKKAYKANVIAYTLSLVFHYIRFFKTNRELDFDRIWKLQDIYEELVDQIRVLSKEVYEYITGPRETENVTEWCKREACWMKAKKQVWTFSDPFLKSLASREKTEELIKEAVSIRKLENEVAALKEIMARGVGYWQKVLQWGKTKKMLTDKEVSILQMVIRMDSTGRTPTESQAKAVIKARERLIKAGMPMQF